MTMVVTREEVVVEVHLEAATLDQVIQVMVHPRMLMATATVTAQAVMQMLDITDTLVIVKEDMTTVSTTASMGMAKAMETIGRSMVIRKVTARKANTLQLATLRDLKVVHKKRMAAVTRLARRVQVTAPATDTIRLLER